MFCPPVGRRHRTGRRGFLRHGSSGGHRELPGRRRQSERIEIGRSVASSLDHPTHAVRPPSRMMRRAMSVSKKSGAWPLRRDQCGWRENRTWRSPDGAIKEKRTREKTRCDRSQRTSACRGAFYRSSRLRAKISILDGQISPSRNACQRFPGCAAISKMAGNTVVNASNPLFGNCFQILHIRNQNEPDTPSLRKEVVDLAGLRVQSSITK